MVPYSNKDAWGWFESQVSASTKTPCPTALKTTFSLMQLLSRWLDSFGKGWENHNYVDLPWCCRDLLHGIWALTNSMVLSVKTGSRLEIGQGVMIDHSSLLYFFWLSRAFIDITWVGALFLGPLEELLRNFVGCIWSVCIYTKSICNMYFLLWIIVNNGWEALMDF